MNKQYNNIAVFKAKPSNNEKAPQFNVKIEMADGTEYEGGLWEKVSKSGVKYLAGSLKEAGGAPQAPARQIANDPIDW